MALEQIEIPCPEIPEISDIPDIPVPGGAELKAFLNFSQSLLPTDCELTFNLLLQLPPLLAVSACFLKVMQLIVKLKDFFDAATSADLMKIGSSAGDMVEAIGELEGCFPLPTVYCPMIKQILMLIIRFLKCFLSTLESILQFQASIDIEAAEGNPLLETTLACAQDSAQVSLSNLMRSLEPLEPIFSAVTAIGGIAQIEIELPDLSSLSLDVEADLGGEEVIASIQQVITTLEDVLDALPC